ncbi:hypothetical protein Acr_07g0009230 [Actinidia rufa]|uniref:RING/U-box superfamily protein n=1 Tax=Actinidia rufa TaxID=165716 RepID=A0A7J0EWY0_9ERIC|nr:hypothetical protein Acr_07g0009230 [Actinidia rufa]
MSFTTSDTTCRERDREMENLDFLVTERNEGFENPNCLCRERSEGMSVPVDLVRERVGEVRELDGERSGEMEGASTVDNEVRERKCENPKDLGVRERETPPDDDCCPICFGDFDVPCKTNCGHWYCGLWLTPSCIERVFSSSHSPNIVITSTLGNLNSVAYGKKPN